MTVGSFPILLGVVAMAASAHLMLKAGMSQVGTVGAQEMREPLALVTSMLTTPLILGAMPLYAAGLVGWTIVLSRLNLSLAYPALALLYLVIPVASWLLFDEKITVLHWIGMGVIVVGVLLVFRAGVS